MWYRLCVDVEENGTVRGWSAERRDTNDLTSSILVGSLADLPGTRTEAVEGIWDLALDRWGVQEVLFP